MNIVEIYIIYTLTFLSDSFVRCPFTLALYKEMCDLVFGCRLLMNYNTDQVNLTFFGFQQYLFSQVVLVH